MDPLTTSAWVALVAAGVLAVGDWTAVLKKSKRLEYFLKPATLAFLIVAAATIDASDDAQRVAFAVALCFGLVGDVFLMLPDRFVPGLAAFLLGHVSYIVGLRIESGSGTAWTVATVVLVVAGFPLARRIVRGASEHNASLGNPVAAYTAVITLMVSAAVVTGEPLAIAGALLFYLSDTLIGWSRFVRPAAWAPLGIIVTYHLGQALLVASLAA
ncbi:MAG: hypothetical protein GEU71_07475 [Actinobacteria bacterium]|nr:hypothetical protein [Actinomycetota bacterium]